MNQLVILHLPSFLRSVREAQGISQKELSTKLGISQPAIAQYEKADTSLSQDTLRRAATLLNLNPDFLQSGIGNPFKRSKEDKIIKMFFQTSQTGEIDFSLINHIADYNEKAAFIFFKPSNFEEANSLRIRKWQAKGLNTYALAIRDSDNNYFLFKRKNDIFFNEKELIVSLKKKAVDNRKTFDLYIEEIDEELYQQIKRWKKIDRSTVVSLFQYRNFQDYQRFIEELIDRIARENILGSVLRGDMFDKMKENLQKRHPSIVNSIYHQILRDTQKFLEDQLR